MQRKNYDLKLINYLKIMNTENFSKYIILVALLSLSQLLFYLSFNCKNLHVYAVFLALIHIERKQNKLERERESSNWFALIMNLLDLLSFCIYKYCKHSKL